MGVVVDARIGSLFGILTILGIAVLFSRHRSRINFRRAGIALLLQSACGYLSVGTTLGTKFFGYCAELFSTVYRCAEQGTAFVFGGLASSAGPWGVVFALQILPTIIVFGALMSVLFHFGVIQLVVRFLAAVIQPLLGTSGAETLPTCASVMLGQTDTPLLIKEYLPRMTDSELLLLMVSGTSHLTGALYAIYGGMGVAVEHLLASAIMGVFGSIVIAKLLLPETEMPETAATAGKPTTQIRTTYNVFDAIAQGTTNGVGLAVNVAAMLITFISLITLADKLLAWVTFTVLSQAYTLNDVFGLLFYGAAYLIGIPAQDRVVAGSLLGQKLVINEFVAFLSLAKVEMLDRSRILLTYALAGFSNFSCIGIQIGGISSLCPEKRTTLTRLGLTALLGGTLVNLLNAAIVSLFL